MIAGLVFVGFLLAAVGALIIGGSGRNLPGDDD